MNGRLPGERIKRAPFHRQSSFRDGAIISDRASHGGLRPSRLSGCRVSLATEGQFRLPLPVREMPGERGRANTGGLIREHPQRQNV